MTTAQSLENPLPTFFGTTGLPLTGGYVYVGVANQDPRQYPVNVYYDKAMSLPVVQPMRTTAGCLMRNGGPTNVWVDGSYSMLVLDSNNRQVFYAAALQPGSAAGLSFLQAGTGALLRPVQDKMRERVSVTDFGAIGDYNGTTGTDNLAAFNAALASFSNAYDTPFSSYTGILEIPPGVYYLSGTWNINRQVKIVGHGSPDANDIGSVRLVFADNVDGIVFQEYRTSGVGTGSGGSLLSGVYLTRKSAGGTLGSGIYIRDRVRIRDVISAGFREHGCKIDATAPVGNANSWEIDCCRFMGNGLDGLFVDGADANAGVAYRLDCSNNTRHGIWDSSFLGNTFVAAHCSGNGAASYRVDNLNAATVFVGCYDESGYTLPDLTVYTTVLGGQLASSATTGHRIGNQKISTGQATKGKATLQFGEGQGVNNSALTVVASDEAAFPWRLTWDTFSWVLRWSDWVPGSVIRLYGALATVANGFARDLTANGAIGLPNGYYDGDVNVLKYRGSRSAVPAAGTWLQGDIVYNTAPASAGFIGWVCTAGGTPGTWKTFGLIS